MVCFSKHEIETWYYRTMKMTRTNHTYIPVKGTAAMFFFGNF